MDQKDGQEMGKIQSTQLNNSIFFKSSFKFDLLLYMDDECEINGSFWVYLFFKVV